MESSATNQHTGFTTTPLVPAAVAVSAEATPQMDTLSVGYGGPRPPPPPPAGEGLARAPQTPQRARNTSHPGSPLTPLANLKMLIAAASTARAMENRQQQQQQQQQSSGGGGGGVGGSLCRQGEDFGDDSNGRKTKSLSILCKKFLSIAEAEVGVGSDFSLERMARSLGTNRRRIYDIINVMEALEMIVKQSKNWYTWLGRDGLLPTLAKLKAMAQDDLEFSSLFDRDVESKENGPPEEGGGAKTDDDSSEEVGVVKPEPEGDKQDEGGATKEQDDDIIENDLSGKGGRWDKSLGVLCQKFVMLFLITPAHEVTLDCAGSVLMPDCSEDNPFSSVPSQSSTSSKTKVRRLYDIANVLTTLGLIKKKSFLAPNHRKMPGYCWDGPPMEEIMAITVYRKPEPFSLSGSVLYSKKKGLARKPSLSSRPFLHQYHVQTPPPPPPPPPHTSSPSLPSTPVKHTAGSGFKRSLSFGAAGLPSSSSNSSSSKCAVARPLSGKQLDYIQELKEFEAEMQKHAHHYPNVASVFREFIQKYQTTIEQAASSGRSILPKPPSTPDIIAAATAKPAPVTTTPKTTDSSAPPTLEKPAIGDSTCVSFSSAQSIKVVEASPKICDITNLQNFSRSPAMSASSSVFSTELPAKTFTKIRICPSNSFSSSASSTMRGKRIISALDPCSGKATFASSAVIEPSSIGSFQTAVRNLRLIAPNLHEVRGDASLVGSKLAVIAQQKQKQQQCDLAGGNNKDALKNEVKNSSPIDELTSVFMVANESPITAVGNPPSKLGAAAAVSDKPSPSYLLKCSPVESGLLESPAGDDSGIGSDSIQEANINSGSAKPVGPRSIPLTISVQEAMAKTGKPSFTEISRLVSDLSSLVNQMPTGKRPNFNPNALLVNPTFLTSSAILKPLLPAVTTTSTAAAPTIAPMPANTSASTAHSAAASTTTTAVVRKGTKRIISQRDLMALKCTSSASKKPRLE